MGSLSVAGTRYRVEWQDGAEQLYLPARRNWRALAFLALWLALWTWGGNVALDTTNPMMVVGLATWALGWCSAATLLVGMAAAVDIVRVHAGELLITRRAGLLGRTWRYRTVALRNLRVDLTPWSGDGTDGAEHLFFLKQQWGAVRLDHGTEIVHLAPHASETEAERISEWLKRQLSVSASL